MSSELLAGVGGALANISGAIAECIRADAQNTPSQGHVDHLQQVFAQECRALRGLDQADLATALEGVTPPLVAVITEGW